MGGHNIYIPRRFTTINFGLLYNFWAISGTGDSSIAPPGWHVPSKQEQLDLVSYLDPSAGQKLKISGNVYWNNDLGTNTSGFRGKGAGYRIQDGSFNYLKIYGSYRHITEEDFYGTWQTRPLRLISNDNDASFTLWFAHGNGLSLRLIKDNSTDPGYMTGNDSKRYRTVKINDQVWMAENSAETKYRDGTSIPEITDNTDWYNLTTGALCAYNNDWSNV